VKQFNSAYELVADGYWARPEFVGIPYSDGAEVESRLESALGSAGDLSCLSDELLSACVDWPSSYHLSKSRANALRPFAQLIQGASSILEIGAGCGAVTRFLGETGASVVAVEGSRQRAKLVRLRTRDLTNVSVVAEEALMFTADRQFDLVTLVGVLEYAACFIHEPDAAVKLLQHAHKLVRPGGALLLAIENKYGLKYFAGYPEDHLGVPMAGIEDRYRSGGVRTFGLDELRQMLRRVGFSCSEFFGAFPDYKFTKSVVRQRAWDHPFFDAGNLVAQASEQDPQRPASLYFNQGRVWGHLGSSGAAMNLANSFLILARPDARSPTVDSTWIGWSFNTTRKSEFCVETSFCESDDGGVTVRKARMSGGPGVVESEGVAHVIVESAPYLKGDLLFSRWEQILSASDWRIADMVAPIANYLSSLRVIGSEPERPGSDGLLAATTNLPGAMLDMIPRNIVIGESGVLAGIDQEWAILGREISIGYLLFRALVDQLTLCPWIRAASDMSGRRRLDLIVALMNSGGLQISEMDIFEFSRDEALLRSRVSGLPLQSMDMEPWLRAELQGS
jgi:SAM-dependent methyltransferase